MDANNIGRAASVFGLIPMAHVADVERSIVFYEHLGFSVLNRLEHGGITRWASLRSANAWIMFARADGPIAPEQQAMLLYLYSNDVAALRSRLLGRGLHDGGKYCGQAGPNDGRCVVFDISKPHYMPEGEIRVSDPDGYCLLIGQCTGPRGFAAT
ncbi:MAG: hypothetical protein U1D55_07170 [Phycisphaerae bacterium]